VLRGASFGLAWAVSVPGKGEVSEELGSAFGERVADVSEDSSKERPKLIPGLSSPREQMTQQPLERWSAKTDRARDTWDTHRGKHAFEPSEMNFGTWRSLALL
jgi:hypothetical protein